MRARSMTNRVPGSIWKATPGWGRLSSQHPCNRIEDSAGVRFTSFHVMFHSHAGSLWTLKASWKFILVMRQWACRMCAGRWLLWISQSMSGGGCSMFIYVPCSTDWLRACCNIKQWMKNNAPIPLHFINRFTCLLSAVPSGRGCATLTCEYDQICANLASPELADCLTCEYDQILSNINICQIDPNQSKSCKRRICRLLNLERKSSCNARQRRKFLRPRKLPARQVE